ncbi:uncharacterized protein LOC129586685 isoform X2 [Paramacrobiotus metropolitanus]|uniref:uncharacterized protein LOC129586685 isoform X2 n=1 Tax=Paramacrobiotus metropolitanus TaxID=2943436 RepID=UPI002445B655|nr:uncharacterized protein LOC129586685 isoform X2 [Paramacrobiotus metropolitanus]
MESFGIIYFEIKNSVQFLTHLTLPPEPPIFDPIAESVVRRAEVISRKLEHHFQQNSRFFQELAEGVALCVHRSYDSVTNRAIDDLVNASAQMVKQQLALPLISKNASTDYANDLKDLFRKDAVMKIDDARASALGDNYTKYLKWSGQWRKCRPVGHINRRSSVLFSVIVDKLLNHTSEWNPGLRTMQPALNPILTNIAVVGTPKAGKTQLARILAQRYGLHLISLSYLYRYMDEILNNSVAVSRYACFLDFLPYKNVIHQASTDHVFLDDTLTNLLLVRFMLFYQNDVRGFVVDEFPLTQRQICALRDGLNGYDYEKLSGLHKQEKSLLTGEVNPHNPPDEPKHPFNLIAVLTTDAATAFRRLRESYFVERVQEKPLIPSVEDVPMSPDEYSAVQKRILQFTSEMQSGLLDRQKTLASHIVQLDESFSLVESVKTIEERLARDLENKLESIVTHPVVDVLKGLRPAPDELITNIGVTSAGHHATPPASTKLDISFIDISLGNDATHYSIQKCVEVLEQDLRYSLKKEESDVISGLYTYADSVPNRDFDNSETESRRSALRTFIYGSSGPDAFLAPKVAEENKKDLKKGADGKKQDPNKIKADAAKSTKGQPSASQKRTAREAKEAEISDDDELNRLKIPRPPRKSDLGNPKVRDYLHVFAKDEKKTFGIPQLPYQSSEDDLSDYDDAEWNSGENSSLCPALQKESLAKLPTLTENQLQNLLKNQLRSISTRLKMQWDMFEQRIEQLYLKTTLGGIYPNGYLVLRLQNALITMSLQNMETGLLNSLNSKLTDFSKPAFSSDIKDLEYRDCEYRTVVGQGPSKPSVQKPTKLLHDISIDVSKTAAPHHDSKRAQDLYPSLLSFPLAEEQTVQQKNRRFQQSSLFLVYQFLAECWRSVELTHFTTANLIFDSISNIKRTILQQLTECKQLYWGISVSHDLQFQNTLFRWQNTFCSLDAAIRCRPQFKELLHSQVVDFHKSLVDDIGANRTKNIFVQEEIMKNGWVEDRMAVMADNYISLIQLEVDTYIDSLNVMRDYIFATQAKFLGAQSGIIVSIPYIDINNLSVDTRRPPPTLTPTFADSKKPKDPKAPEPEKPTASMNSTLLRPLNRDPLLPTYIARKINAPEPPSMQLPTAEPPPSQNKKLGGAKVDRKSQPDAVRKHSKTQALVVGPPPPRDNVEEVMLREIFDKVKEAVRKIEDSEQETRKALTLALQKPEDPRKTPGLHAKGHDKSRPASPVAEAAPPQRSTHEKAIEDESAFLLARLETILNCAVGTVSELKKMIKTVDTGVTAKIDEVYKRELVSAALLAEFIHAQIENELPIDHALAYQKNHFILAEDEHFHMESDPELFSNPANSHMSLYEEFLKICNTSDKLVCEDLQKAFIYGAERSYGKGLVSRRWNSLDSDELNSAATHQIACRTHSKVPDGVNIQSAEMQWHDVSRLMCASE